MPLQLHLLLMFTQHSSNWSSSRSRLLLLLLLPMKVELTWQMTCLVTWRQ
jgi:hypothetical protein